MPLINYYNHCHLHIIDLPVREKYSGLKNLFFNPVTQHPTFNHISIIRNKMLLNSQSFSLTQSERERERHTHTHRNKCEERNNMRASCAHWKKLCHAFHPSGKHCCG